MGKKWAKVAEKPPYFPLDPQTPPGCLTCGECLFSTIRYWYWTYFFLNFHVNHGWNKGVYWNMGLIFGLNSKICGLGQLWNKSVLCMIHLSLLPCHSILSIFGFGWIMLNADFSIQNFILDHHCWLFFLVSFPYFPGSLGVIPIFSGIHVLGLKMFRELIIFPFRMS